MLERAADAPLLLASGPTLLGPGWTCVDSLDDLDDEYEDEDEEDMYITMDLGATTDPRSLAAETRYQLIGMDTAMPLLKVGTQIYQGELTPLVGTELVLGLVRNEDDPQHPTHPPRHLAANRLTMRAITLHAGPAPVPVPQAPAGPSGTGTGLASNAQDGSGAAGTGKQRDGATVEDEPATARQRENARAGPSRLHERSPTTALSGATRALALAPRPTDGGYASRDGELEPAPAPAPAPETVPELEPGPQPELEQEPEPTPSIFDADDGEAPELKSSGRRLPRVYKRGPQPAVVRNIAELWAAREQVERGQVQIVIADDADAQLQADVALVTRDKTRTGPITKAAALHLASARPLTGKGSRGKRNAPRGTVGAGSGRRGAAGRIEGSAHAGAGAHGEGEAGPSGGADSSAADAGTSTGTRGRGRGRARGQGPGRGRGRGRGRGADQVAPSEQTFAYVPDPMHALFYGQPADAAGGARGDQVGGHGGETAPGGVGAGGGAGDIEMVEPAADDA
ncbi:hypothetical protein Q5752_004709 [Cryptotrichosporon argae]